jgi:two-component system capsular synthesis response regulator RcsB
MLPENTNEARPGIRAGSTRHPDQPHAPVDRIADSKPDVRIIVADDHPLILFAVAEALKVVPPLTCKIVAAVRSGRELLATLETQPCELVVTDFSMDPTQADDGLPFILHLRHRFPDLPVVVFTMLTNGGILQEILQMGVAGIASKDDSVDALTQVCASALRGEWPALSPGIRKRVACQSAAGSVLRGRRPLSPGELEVVRLYGLGVSVTAISRQLKRSVTTVATQKRIAMRKLHVKTNADLVRFVTEVMLSGLNDTPRRLEGEST